MIGDSSLDPVVLDPDKFDVRLENGRVRVLEARIAPGQGHGMHWRGDETTPPLSMGSTSRPFGGRRSKDWCERFS